ncbi:MAG: hypothetical protein WDO19_09680 [Bacteroidota bacterium]
MNPNLQHLVVQEVKKALGKNDDKTLSRYEYAKSAWKLRKNIWSMVRSAIFMAAGIISAGFGYEVFLFPMDLLTGV